MPFKSLLLALLVSVRALGERSELQRNLDPQADYSAEAAVTGAGKAKLTLYRETKPGKKAVSFLPCVLDYRGRAGQRWECGGEPSVFELVFTPGEPDGGGILYLRDRGLLKQEYERCEISERAGRLASWRCLPKPPPSRVEEEDLVSPIKSTLPGAAFPNLHAVDSGGSGHVLLIRGMAPRHEADYRSLVAMGVSRVLIFKERLHDEVDRERLKWAELGLGGDAVRVVPFPWKDFPDFEVPCRETVQALRLLLDAKAHNQTIFFHCTVGEDRTGYLAGLYRLLTEGADHLQGLFQEELCERGYEKGDPYKPYDSVVLKIREALTREFLRMAYKIRKGELSRDKLDPQACAHDPGNDLEYRTDPLYNPERYHCQVSTRFRP